MRECYLKHDELNGFVEHDIAYSPPSCLACGSLRCWKRNGEVKYMNGLLTFQ